MSSSSSLNVSWNRGPRIPVSPPPTTPRLRRHFVETVCESLKEMRPLMPRLHDLFSMLKAIPSSSFPPGATSVVVVTDDTKDAVNELQGFLYEMLREHYFITHATKAVGLGMIPEFNELWTFVFGFYYDQLWEDQISMDTVKETDIEDWFVSLPSACSHCASTDWMIDPVLSKQTRTIGCGACAQRVASMCTNLFPTTVNHTHAAAPTTIGAVGTIGSAVVTTATTTNNGDDQRMTPLQPPATPHPSSTTPAAYMQWPTPPDTATRPMPVVPPQTPSPPQPGSKEHSPAEDSPVEDHEDQAAEDEEEEQCKEDKRVDGLTLAQRNHWYAQTLLQYQTVQREYAARMV